MARIVIGKTPMNLSLVIPCFNEEDSIPELMAGLDRAVAELGAKGHEVEVILGGHPGGKLALTP